MSAVVEEKVIDKHQARIFVLIVVAVVLMALAVVLLSGATPDVSKVQDALVNLAVGASGLASGVIVFWLMFSHDKAWWGNAYGAIVFIGIGALLSTLLSGLQIYKAIAAAMSS